MPTPRQYTTNAERQKAYRERQQQARKAELQRKGLPPSPAVATMPGTRRWNALIEQARTPLDTCREEMQTYFDDRSEQWQESDKAQEMQERIDTLSELVDGISELQ